MEGRLLQWVLASLCVISVAALPTGASANTGSETSQAGGQQLPSPPNPWLRLELDYIGLKMTRTAPTLGSEDYILVGLTPTGYLVAADEAGRRGYMHQGHTYGGASASSRQLSKGQKVGIGIGVVASLAAIACGVALAVGFSS